jgi:hypothetical protein
MRFLYHFLSISSSRIPGTCIAHAKPRQEYGVKPQRSESPGAGPDAGRDADAERKGISDVGMWEGGKVVLKLEA